MNSTIKVVLKSLIAVLLVAAVNGCSGGSGASGTEGNGAFQTNKNKVPPAYAGQDIRVPVGEVARLEAQRMSDEEGDTLTYIWTLIEKPEGSNAVLRRHAGVTTSFEVDVEGTYKVVLLVDDGHDRSADIVHVSTALKAEDFCLTIDRRNMAVRGKWKYLSHVNDNTATATVLTQPPHGFVSIEDDEIIFERIQSHLKTVGTVTGMLVQPSYPVQAQIRITNEYGEIKDVNVTIREGSILQGRLVNPNPNWNTVDHWEFDLDQGGDMTINILSEYPGNPDQMDIDDDGSIDPVDIYIYLFRKNDHNQWVYVDKNDDSDEEDAFCDGTIHNYDSYLRLQNLPSGRYMLAVGNYFLSEEDALAGQNSDTDYKDGGPYRVTITGDARVGNISAPQGN